MWRIVTIIVGVIVVDFLLLLWAEGNVFDYDCTEVMRFVDAREHPTPDTMRAFEAARDKTLEIQGRVRLQFGSAIFLVTAGGFFMAGRQFALRKKNVMATSGEEAASRT
jgi:hypothetical protein